MQEAIFIEHLTPLMQHMLVFLGLAYLFTKTPVFTALVNNTLTWPDKIVIYFVFSGFCIFGTWLSEPSVLNEDAIANTRLIGAVLGGLLGGPVVGFFVGLTGGLHRIYSMTSSIDPVTYVDIACGIATTLEGLIAGLVHFYFLRKNQIERLFSQKIVCVVSFGIGVVHVGVILIAGSIAGDWQGAVRLEQEIALPMLIANTVGVALIIYLIREQKNARDELTGQSIAWQIADKTADIVYGHFDQVSSEKIARIIQQETRVAAVAITDTQRLLAFTGQGDDHHVAGATISSSYTIDAINQNQVIFADGIHQRFQCRVDDACKLGSVLVIPLRDKADKKVLGTIKLYETKDKLFKNINRKLGETIANYLSNKILAGRYELQRSLRVQDQYRLLTAQVNPHFLYNALATISHIIGKQPNRARRLLQDLSNFFRKNLETSGDTTSLKQELDHVLSYLEIEKARFEYRLQVNIEIPESLYKQIVPVFTLQPIVENAIKHGVSQMLGPGCINISSAEQSDEYTLTVADNAGLYKSIARDGVGLKIDERIKIRFGSNYGITINCEPGQWTRVNIRLPKTDKEIR